jgi:hypothetical protein
MLSIMCIDLHTKCPFFFLILIKLAFSRYMFDIQTYKNFMTIRRVGAEFFHADRQTNITKIIVAFHEERA